MGKNDVRPAGSRASPFRFRATILKYYTYIYEIWHIFGPYALAVPFGGHIAIAYSFPVIMKNMKFFFFSFPDQNF